MIEVGYFIILLKKMRYEYSYNAFLRSSKQHSPNSFISMKKILLSMALLLAACVSLPAAGQTQVDRAGQVLLTIDRKPVTLGEFEYLYHKNNSQQMVPQTIDQYLDMFINYKLKVAEAEAAGIDTTATFLSELRGYARDLAQPYLTDHTVEQKIIDDIYNRLKEEVNVSHIMLFTGNTPAERETNRTRLDSLRTVIMNGGDFESIAAQYSIDRASRDRGGNMGYITAMRFPYTFEDATYNTPVGQLSGVIETPYGYHIVKPIDRRPARGQVLVQHILKLTRGMSPGQVAAKHHEIDSIHTLLAAGADFDDMAARESEDPGSARQGGRLPWFSTGRMVKPFEDASFALKDGELSEIIESDFGYHIIKRLDSKELESKEELTPAIREAIAQDDRGSLPRRAALERFKKKYNLVMNRPAIAMVESVIRSNGGYDSVTMERFGSMPVSVATFDGDGKVLLTQVVAGMSPMKGMSPDQAFDVFTRRMNAMVDEAITNRAIDDMADDNADYRNLLKEYRDGILLFEISDRKVWSRAKEDTEGLDRWFRSHRDRYTWETPKFKSYIIFATSDSILNVANRFLAENKTEGKYLAATLRQLCGRDVRVERVIAAKGENAIVDYLGFNGEKPSPTGKWVAYVAYQPVILDAPVEVADERGAVTADYQSFLEESWIKDMRSRHKIKINKKVLKQAQ